jgi:phosphohistidine phosphatase
MRHADSFPTDFSGYESERPLSVTGLLQIEEISETNKQLWSGIDFVLCSSVKRAKQTFQAIYSTVHSRTKFMFDDNLYQIATFELRDKIKWTPTIYNKILIVGHNPCLSQFIAAIFPQKEIAPLDTCEAAILQADVESWQEVDFNRLELVNRIKPHIGSA